MKFIRCMVILIAVFLLFSCSNPSDVITPPSPTPPSPVDPVEPDPDPDPIDPTPPEEEKIFKVDKTTVTIDGKGGSDTVVITSTYDDKINVSNSSSWIHTSLDSKVLTITLDKNTVWQRNATIMLSVSDKIIKITVTQNSNQDIKKINKFLSGITSPLPSELKYTVPGTNKQQQNWNETQTTQWFNVKKIATGVGVDSNMCYAISAANMTHWWLSRNLDYVNDYVDEKLQKDSTFDTTYYYPKYDKTKLLTDFLNEDGELSGEQVLLWQNYEKEKSDYGKLVRENFSNSSSGGDNSAVLNWIFNGKQYQKDNNKLAAPLGLFQDKGLFEKNLVETVGVTGQSKEYIENLLKNSVNNGEIIGLVYTPFQNGVPSGSSHAVTCYGIIEDEEGNVIGLWINDNNLEDKGVMSYGLTWTIDTSGYNYSRLDLTNLSSSDYGSLKGSMASLTLITILHNIASLPQN